MEQIPTDADVLTSISRFCDSHGIKPSAFGRLAVGDGNLVGDLRAGKRSITLKTAARLADFMTNYRPSERGEAA